MSEDQKDERFSIRFLDCDCQCCGVRQQSVPSISCPKDQNHFEKLIKNLSKARYGLDCQCLCSGKSPMTSKDPCVCPTAKPATPIQLNFSIDTGIRHSTINPESQQKK